MKNYFVAYDLNAPGQSYQRVIEAIEQLGQTVKIQFSLFYLKTDLTEKEVAEHVARAMDANDTVIVIEASGAYYQGIKQEAADQMRRLWPQ